MSGYNCPQIFFRATDHAGKPVPGAALYHHVTNTTIPKAIFADFELEDELPQPLIADAEGLFQQFFLEPGQYTFRMYDAPLPGGNLLRPPENHIAGTGGDGSGTGDHLVIVDDADQVPGTLQEKLEDTDDIIWAVASGGPEENHRIRATVSAGAGDTYKIKTNTSDTPGFLNAKIANTPTVELEIVSNKLQANVVGPHTVKVDETDPEDGFLAEKIEDTDGIHWEISGTESVHRIRGVVQPGAGDTFKFKLDADDTIAGFASDKIKAGTGITINVTEDEVDGSVMHINANSQSTGKVKATSTDTTADYLDNKLVAGPGMTITPVVAGATTLVLAPVTNYLEDVRSQSNKLNVGLDYPSTQNVCSLVLTAGAWEVEGSIASYVVATTDVGSRLVGNIGNSATIDTDGFDGWAQAAMLVGYDTTWSATSSITIPRRRLTVATTRTIYLVAQQGIGPFTICQMWGNLTARKVT